MSSLNKKVVELVAELGLADAASIKKIQPLTGGVSSDIFLVDLGGERICVKFALPKLKVAANWEAPVHRNKAEYEWLKFATAVSPENGLKLLGRSNTLNGFAMEFIAGDDVYLLKTEWLAGRTHPHVSQKVGEMLGKIQSASVRDEFVRSSFENIDDFHAIRIEPYLEYTINQNQDLASQLSTMADWLYANQNVLVHGDVSPKNIVFRDGMPIALDAECATMGDASFDPAFFLNHLVLKSFHLPSIRSELVANIDEFWCAYHPHVSWEAVADLEARITTLLPMLMLARVDGKSPVEYLTPKTQTEIRRFARDLILSPVSQVKGFRELLEAYFGSQSD